MLTITNFMVVSILVRPIELTHLPRGVRKAQPDGSPRGWPAVPVSPGSGQVWGQILAGLPLDDARVPARPYRAPGWARRCPREETVPVMIR